MSIHKLIRKPTFDDKRQPPTVHWKPHGNLSYKAMKILPRTWLIYTQENINIKSQKAKSIELKFGVEFSTGVVSIFLKNKLKEKACILEQNLIEGIDDIITFIQNNSDQDLTLHKGHELCYVHYHENI